MATSATVGDGPAYSSVDANGRPRRRGLAGAVLILACAALCGGVPAAAASGPDAAATHAYLIARYRLAGALLHRAAAGRTADRAAAARIARECPGAVAGMPPTPSLASLPVSSPRVRGENARLSQQTQTIEGELDAAVTQAGGSLDRPAEEAYAAEVRRLSWSNPAIAAALQAQTTARLQAVSAPAPSFCADAKAWAQSGYRALSAASREFEAGRAAQRDSEREEVSVDALLKPYEDASDRALIRKTGALESRLAARALAGLVTVLGVEPIVGFPKPGLEEPKQTPVGHGRTAAGTRFQVSTGAGSGSGPSNAGGCRRSASVFYSPPGVPELLVKGGSNNPICLSPPRYRRPALFCEAGIETIQTAVPAAVRSVTLMLADGRTIESRVVRVSRRAGGPTGIYAQELRGTTSHAVALVELDAARNVVRSLKLRRYRCVKPREEPKELPASTVLARGRTPEGEPFTITVFGSLDAGPSNILSPFLSIDAGINQELDRPAAGPGASKAFPWSLSVGCGPHPYAILYGLLQPPGTSVVAQTPQGAVALNLVPVEPRLHAKGPLVYGVFGALPSELTVLGPNGSTLYSENLQTQAAEAAQFCEGYAES